MFEISQLVRRILVLFVGVTANPSGPIAVDKFDFAKTPTTQLYPDELSINWDYYQDRFLDIEGKIECLTDRYCDFVPISGLPQVVWIGIDRLDSDKKRNLTAQCQVSCVATIYGQVGLANFTAWQAWIIEPR
jgi:hypothetical protein